MQSAFAGSFGGQSHLRKQIEPVPGASPGCAQLCRKGLTVEERARGGAAGAQAWIHARLPGVRASTWEALHVPEISAGAVRCLQSLGNDNTCGFYGDSQSPYKISADADLALCFSVCTLRAAGMRN